MISPVLFWSVAFLTVVPALSLLFAKKAVHIAMSIVAVMVGLAVAYVALDAPFLGVVQIVVYTGAVMMLFLFVLMLVGVDQRESMKETLKGQRWIAVIGAGGLAILLISAIGQLTYTPADTMTTGDPDKVANLLFSDYPVVMEILGALLITAAVGALVLTHTPRLTPRRGQAELQKARVLAGANPVNKPMPGVYARHNALDVPALDPEGKSLEDSVSRVLEIRHQTQEGVEFRAALKDPSKKTTEEDK
ncbi:NADH-quinone oxidoreductase subunit J [Demequina capsici]|uniref:NADH-quinone oxidoreductase subunit J n=1 Tax=Demequina capsici TaxID=3075620 RepID=A0AA96JAH7_9MICO|nr:NADH-quinone oxidoreductase subunit J [Demequina sp. PMTSA13]WNM26998.1 NADH-quinone oxidoreductase subunit J [Demequina sp. PMTSA13]